MTPDQIARILNEDTNTEGQVLLGACQAYIQYYGPNDDLNAILDQGMEVIITNAVSMKVIQPGLASQLMLACNKKDIATVSQIIGQR